MRKMDCQFWHPSKGGWYAAILIRKGYKWAVIVDISGRRKRVAASDVRGV